TATDLREYFALTTLNVSPAGKLVVQGYSSHVAEEKDFEESGGAYGHTHLCVVMLNPSGTPDTHFDGNGIRFHFGSFDVPLFTPDGKMTFVGQADSDSAPLSGLVVFKFAPDGSFTYTADTDPDIAPEVWGSAI